KVLTFLRRKSVNILEKTPVIKDAQSAPQLTWRTMFNLYVDLWHTLSVAEKAEWESAARSRHMTGYAWYISQCLRPNPGIYLPLAGGKMQGDIDMEQHRLKDLPLPGLPFEAARKWDLDTLEARWKTGARVYHDVNQAVPHATWTTLAFNSERYDTASMHSTVINNDRITVLIAGKYVCGVCVQWEGNVNGLRQVMIELNRGFFNLAKKPSPFCAGTNLNGYPYFEVVNPV
ncbi:unnamed protein product, partial [marine sediment metagenome]